MAENAAGLLLEVSLVVVPVDEPRRDQRSEQRDNDGSTDDQVQSIQNVLRLSPTVLLYAMSKILPGFMMPFGSIARLIARITSTPAPCSRARYLTLP